MKVSWPAKDSTISCTRPSLNDVQVSDKSLLNLKQGTCKIEKIHLQ